MVPTQVASLLWRVAAATGPALDRPPQWTGLELLGSAAVEFVVTAVGVALVGVVVSTVAPDFTDGGVEYLRAEPGEAFVYGVAAYVTIVVAMFLLAVTVVGLVVVIPAVIVLAILGFGGTAVSVIALGTWIRSAFGSDAGNGRETALVVGAVAWAGLGVIPVLGGLVTFVVGAMGFGYLALWLANGQFGRDYGSVDAGGGGGSGGSRRDPAVSDRRDAGDAHPDDDPDRFRNIAALDAEREAEENEQKAVDDESDSADRER